MVTVVGAYGKNYNNIVSAVDAWDRGKDFQILEGAKATYINKSDWHKYLNSEVVAYQGHTSTWILQESE